jgi:hypothetical protein
VRGRAPSDQNEILTETRASPWRDTKRLVSAREQVLTPPERKLIQKEIDRGGGLTKYDGIRFLGHRRRSGKERKKMG